jgi:hypothetical protein
VWLNKRPLRPISTSCIVPLLLQDGHTGIFGNTTVPQTLHFAPSNAGAWPGSEGMITPGECNTVKRYS